MDEVIKHMIQTSFNYINILKNSSDDNFFILTRFPDFKQGNSGKI